MARPTQPFGLRGLSCRLCWRITLAVFCSIFAVEAAILIPSYRNYERDLLARLDEVGRTAVTAGFVQSSHLSDRDYMIVAGTLKRRTPVLGGTFYRSDGSVFGSFGEAPTTTLERFRKNGRPGQRFADGTRFEAVWLPSQTALPFTVIARLDASHIGAKLHGFLRRVGLLALVISTFVCAVTMVIVGRTVLVPLLDIRDNLANAGDDPASADRFVLPETRRDELGDTAITLNQLLYRVAKTHREELPTVVAMSDQAAAALVVFNVDGRVVYANESCLTLCGANSMEEMEQRGLLRYRSDEVLADTDLMELLRPGTFAGEGVIVGSGGRRVPCIVRGVRMDVQGETVRYFAAITDITELHAAWDRLEQQNVALAASNRAKDEFLANMSHEPRTPLNAIIGFSEVMRGELEGEIGNPLYKDYINEIHDSGQHLLKVINDILDLSKIGVGKLDLEEEVLAPAATIESTIRLIKGRVDADEIEVVFEPADALPRLRADERKLKQILINLLSNAVKFTPAGGRVRVSAEVEPDGRFAIAVADTGIGIPDEDQQRVFSTFVQVDSGFNRRFEGTGLGLPLAKSMVELHGGSIDLTSRLGEGTTVTIRLPGERIVGADELVIA